MRDLTARAAALVVLVVLAGCGETAAPAAGVTVACDVAPAAPTTKAPATVTVTLADAAKAPVAGARVRVEGNMSHPGMEPVFADAREVAPGKYEAPFSFDMAGDWVLTVDATLAGGAKVTKDVKVSGVRAG